MAWFFCIFGAVLSVLLAWWVPLLATDWRYRRRNDVMGHWLTAWQPIYVPSHDWIEQECDITARFGQLLIKCSESNATQYDWVATGRLVDGHLINGEWREVKPGAHALGVFMLAVDSEGCYMVGHSLGTETPKTKILGCWALGRTPEDLERAKGRLKEARIRFPRTEQKSANQ